MRGKLIFVFFAEFARLDRTSMKASAQDADFREPRARLLAAPDDVPARDRRELALVRVPCQVEPQRLEELRSEPAGNAPRSRLDLVVHFDDLERLGLVDARTGVALLAPGDRLHALYDRAGAHVQTFRDPPGLYVTEVRPLGFGLGLSCSRRNLALVVLEERRAALHR